MNRGFTLVELLVVVLLVGLLGGLAVRGAASGRRGLERVAASAATVESARLARVLLDRVAREGGVRAGSRVDEVEVTLPVGWALRCDSVWAWSGIRAPDPTRDRVEVTDGSGRRHAVSLVSVAGAPCAAAPEAGRSFTVDPAIPGGVLLRVFESGVVRVDDAVRYARAGTSRQPISAAGLDPATSRVTVRDGRVEVAVDDGRARFVRRW